MAFTLRGLLVPAHVAPDGRRLAHGLAFISAPDEIPDPESGLETLDWAARTAADVAPQERAALIEVECWGACNYGAAGFDRGSLAFGPLRTRDDGDDRSGYDVSGDRRDTAVNQALRWLGVTAEPGHDEFASVGLETLGR